MIHYKKILLLSVSGVLLCHQPGWSNTIYMDNHHLSESLQVAESAFNQAEYTINDCITGPKNPVSAMALNIVPLGFGSYQQGDIFGGVTLSTIDGLGLGILGLAAYGFMTGQSWGAAFITPGGIALLGLGRVLGFIFPWTHVMYTSDVTCAPEATTGAFLSYSTSF